MTLKLVLCQDCLAIKPYTIARHDSEEPCECGGYFCGCKGCNDHANELQSNSDNKLCD